MLRFILAVCLLATGLISTTPAEAAERRLGKPNVMLIYVDDMRADDMKYMDFTRNFFANNGTTFENGISPHPLCCPARAELMTGQYAQNNGVYHNDAPFGGYPALEQAGKFKLTPEWFDSEGYDTAYIGKYMNEYKGGPINGVDVTEALSANVYQPYDFTSWNNGDEKVRDSHTTLWTGRRTENLIADFGAGPFFTISAFLAPHRMKKNGAWVPPYARAVPSAPVPIPPRAYRDVEPGDEVPPSFSKPSYNEEDMSDKPSVVRKPPIENSNIRAQHEARVLSLYAVDDQIRSMVNMLKNTGRFSNTIIAFTSDNGYLMGEHRHDGKDQPYIESLRVPMMLAGPGVPVAATSAAPVTTVDLPKTLANLAGVPPHRTQDGQNMLAVSPNRAVLIQSGSSTERFDFRGIFTKQYTYVEHSTGEKEFYDRDADPYELDSDPSNPNALALASILRSLRDCKGGAECTATYN